MVKKLLICTLFVLICSSATAFLYDDVEILSQEQIKQLSNDDLMERYIQAKIEEKTSQEFHIRAGPSICCCFPCSLGALRIINVLMGLLA